MRWLRHYDQGIPETLAPYPERTLLDDVAEAVAERPGAPALLFKGRTVTYGELDRLSDAFAVALAELGVARGDRVALLLPNCPQFLICELGAWKAGAILVPLNPIYTEQELAGALGRTGAEIIVVLTPFYGRVKAAHALIQTSEPRLYANIILRKGVIYPKENAHTEVDPFVY